MVVDIPSGKLGPVLVVEYAWVGLWHVDSRTDAQLEEGLG